MIFCLKFTVLNGLLDQLSGQATIKSCQFESLSPNFILLHLQFAPVFRKPDPPRLKTIKHQMWFESPPPARESSPEGIKKTRLKDGFICKCELAHSMAI